MWKIISSTKRYIAVTDYFRESMDSEDSQTGVVLSELLFHQNLFKKVFKFQLKSSYCTKERYNFFLVDRTFLLSDFMFHTKNLIFIINVLLDNDYPLTFIFDIVQRIKNLLKNKTHST